MNQAENSERGTASAAAGMPRGRMMTKKSR